MKEPRAGDRGWLTAVRCRIEKIRSPLIDLHDPEGIYFHRAGNACLATLLAACILYFFPGVRPLLVLSASCFTLTTGPLNRPGETMTLFGSLASMPNFKPFLASSRPVFEIVSPVVLSTRAITEPNTTGPTTPIPPISSSSSRKISRSCCE